MDKPFDWRPPRGGVAWIAVLFFIGSLYYMIRGGDSVYTHYVCPFFLPISIGLWLKQSWARWIMFAFFVLVAVLFTISLFDQPISVRRVARGFIIAGVLLSLWEWKVYSEAVEPEPEAA
ncbi:hypothetical protein [Lacipirellula parvula]|uniref:Uncharacterized protein n=1 Tax=Lacipirellula parvula TaxID=2650471 RepID=A0A5K7XMY5_9BACT|nr:hypothetical protein [Lacipirellula parvula]BBO34489.1 hypothetical protein PLANPX_4101 [Lacipirellula parvula]